MVVRTWRIAAVAVTVTGLLAVGAPAIAAPAHTPAAVVPSPPPVGVGSMKKAMIASPLNKVFTARTTALGKKVTSSNPPRIGWQPALPARTQPLAKGKATLGTVSPQLAPSGTTVGAPGLGALPYFSFTQAPLTTDTVARVNLGNGNLLLTSNDGSLFGPGLGLRNDRFYNGLSTAKGSLGGGWSSPLSAFDVGLAVSGSTATYTGANGFTAAFTQSGSTWTGPASFDATLTGSSTHVLTFNQTGEKLTFSTSGWLISDTDRNGAGNTYTYGSGGRISSITNAAGRSYSVTWASGTANQIATITDSAGRATTYTQNSSGQLTRVDSPGGYWEAYGYDSSGRINDVQAVGTDNTKSSTTREITFGYDSSSRVTSMTMSGVGDPNPWRQWQFAYTSGQTTVTDPNSHVTTYTIDSSGRVTSTQTPRGNTFHQAWTSASKVATSTDALASGSTPGNSTTYSYDSLNNATKVTFPAGAAASATYALGTGCTGSTGTAYEPHCTLDAAGNGKKLDYDTNGNLTKITDTTSGGTGAVTNQYTYASATGCPGTAGIIGQVCTATDGNGNTTTYGYDTAGNLTSVTPPSPMHATTYTYDTLGRVASVTDPNGDTTYFTYNDRDELLSKYFADGVYESYTFWWNALPQTDVTGANTGLYWAYDNVGGYYERDETVGGVTRASYYTYDPAGNVLTEDSDEFGTTTYTYDSDNNLASMTEPGGSCGSGPTSGSGCITFAYDANDHETQRTFPGGAKMTTTYDGAGRVTKVTGVDASSVTKADVRYSYQAAGTTGASGDRTAIQSRTSILEQGIPAGAITSYSYDSLNRLTNAAEKNGATTVASWAYSYDDSGNRTQEVLSGTLGTAPGAGSAGTTSYTYNADNELTSTSSDTSTWSYDDAGNQTNDGLTGTSSTVNQRGGVASIGTSTTYAELGGGNTNTLTRTDGSTTTRYPTTALGLRGAMDSGSYTAFGRNPKTGTLVSTEQTGAVRAYYVNDALGSAIGMFSSTGSWLGGYSYSPYGEPMYTSSNSVITANPLRYIGGYQDSSANSVLYRLGARYYDPTIGRFTQYDPSGQEANPYAYAQCNPINAKDSTGLSCTDAFISYVGNVSAVDLAVGAAVGAAALSEGAAIPFELGFGFATAGVAWTQIGTAADNVYSSCDPSDIRFAIALVFDSQNGIPDNYTSN